MTCTSFENEGERNVKFLSSCVDIDTIRSFYKCLLSIYYMPGIVPCTVHVVVKNTDISIIPSWSLCLSGWRWSVKKINKLFK